MLFYDQEWIGVRDVRVIMSRRKVFQVKKRITFPSFINRSLVQFLSTQGAHFLKKRTVHISTELTWK